jgi:hypothetical protein
MEVNAFASAVEVARDPAFVPTLSFLVFDVLLRVPTLVIAALSDATRTPTLSFLTFDALANTPTESAPVFADATRVPTDASFEATR